MPRVSKASEDTAPEVVVRETPPPDPQIKRIIRELTTVLVEVPLCNDPPGAENLHGTFGAHINVHLYPSLTRRGRMLLHQLYHALIENGAKLENGKPINSRNHAVVWLIEQLNQEA
jgi:hypothetical protein